jgi:putative ABC transport system permease protein
MTMPRALTRFRLLLRSLLRRPQVDRELDEELQDHLERQIEEERKAGLTPEEARFAALRALGAITQNREECRDMRGVNWIEDLLQDLGYGVRTLYRNAGFSVVAGLALALGIGVNTAMFSVAYGMLLRPLPYADAGRVAVVHLSYSPRDFLYGTMCIRDYLMWREHNHAFENPALFRGLRMDIAGTQGVPEQVQGASVTAGFFSTLRVPPLIGRIFASGDDRPATNSMAVLGEGIWRRRFGASPAVVGQTILINGAPSTVIGVVPARFQLPRRETEVWTNLVLNPPTRYGPWFYRGIARLKPGVTLEEAQAEVNRIGRLMMEQNPYYQRLTMPLLSLRDAMLGPTLKPAILVLAGAVGLVLLIAAVNVANLMLARATVRQREMALRLSLGAGRGRLVRQLLTESMLLAVAGGTGGLAIAWGGIGLIRVWNPGNLPLIDAVRLDVGALGFMLAAAMVTGILFGLAPALESVRADLNSTIKEGARGGAGKSRGRMRAALVVCEIAVSLMLLVGAGLLLRSFANLQQVSGGYSTAPRRMLTMIISPGNPQYGDGQAGLPFYEEVRRRAQAVPEVETAALSDALPPDRQGDADTFGIEGQTLAPPELNPVISMVTVDPGFFPTLGIPLTRGRGFTSHDNPDSTPVAVVSEAFARRFFPHQDAVGKRVRRSGAESGNPWMQIVGIAGNVKYLGLAVDTDPAIYVPFSQSYQPLMFLAVRTRGDAARVADRLRREIQAIDPGITLAQIGTMEQAMNLSVSQPRFDTLLLVLFAAIALMLAAVGIYGLIAYSVTQRTHEIGVRVALGAARSDVLRMIVQQGVRLAAAGIAVGLGGALVLTRLLGTMLFGIGATDALTFLAAPLGMLLVVVLAVLAPAMRATRISPVTALRYD